MVPGKHSISEEKPLPDGGGMRLVKRRFGRGLRKYGWIERHRTPAGEPRRSVFWAPRKTDEKMVSEQAWLVPTATVDELRNYGVTHVVLAIEDGSQLQVPFGLFGPKGMEQGVRKLPARPGLEAAWAVPESLFEVTLPAREVREQTMLELMQVKPGRAKRN